MKKCVTCLQLKPEDDFNFKVRALGLRQPWCREGQHAHQGKWYQNHKEQEKARTQKRRVRVREQAKEYVYSYLLNHPCVDCGESDPRVLEFDHVKGKARNVAELIHSGASLHRIKIEIGLCVVRCANCHRKKTIKELNWFRGKKRVGEKRKS